jgi:hypothetical protein
MVTKIEPADLSAHDAWSRTQELKERKGFDWWWFEEIFHANRLATGGGYRWW